MADLLSETEINNALPCGGPFRSDGKSLRAAFRAPDFLTGIELVRRTAGAAAAADHHPDIDIRWRTVAFVLTTHSAGGITAADLTLAALIAAAAEELGALPAG